MEQGGTDSQFHGTKTEIYCSTKEVEQPSTKMINDYFTLLELKIKITNQMYLLQIYVEHQIKNKNVFHLRSLEGQIR